MQFKQSTIWLFMVSSVSLTFAGANNWNACGGRLERALDALHRDSTKREKLDEEENGTFYQRELRSIPLEMSVTRMAIKVPQGNTEENRRQWARVERCVYEPKNSSLRTRIVFNDLAVSGLVSLMPRDHHLPIPAESCRMTLRLRRAGIDFHTSPIARGRGQMRIRTESSFLEPRFASIYAYGCHPVRNDKQIKRQDKWPSHHSNDIKVEAMDENYDEAEPRHLADITEEVDIIIPNENRRPRYLHAPDTNLGIWRTNSWITKSSLRQKRSTIHDRNARTATPKNLTDAFVNEQKPGKTSLKNFTDILDLSNEDSTRNVSREVRELILDEDLDNLFPIDSEDNPNRSWQSKEHITKEMEDVFLHGTSQVLTRYIERQLHPAIKETLMLSMGYTISYG